MTKEKFAFYEKQAIIKSDGEIPETTTEITETDIFHEVVYKFVVDLKEKDSPLLSILPKNISPKLQAKILVNFFQELTTKKLKELRIESTEEKKITKDAYTLSLFVEALYDFWRSYERFFIYYTTNENNATKTEPYAHFNEKVEKLNYLVRKTYRDIAYNITEKSLTVYRQVPAACQMGLIVSKEEKSKLPKAKQYEKLKDIHFIKQVTIQPPLIINPSTNTRSGEFTRVYKHPFDKVVINDEDWLCYPAKVGELLIYFYFHNKFIGTGSAVANLFDLATDKEMERKPDGIYLCGVNDEAISGFESKTVFYEDEKNDVLVAAIPRQSEFGYFGYIKKMLLTLHNIIMMKRERMPVHGAMVRISLKNNKSANIVIWGDSGAGKSETLEAFRTLSGEYLRDMKIIFDDMGSLELVKDGIKAYGTETGAFVRLDDLSLEYAFGSIDRAIIMNPNMTNARTVIPITTMEEVLKGYNVDYLLYANNFEEIDEYHPVFEKLDTLDKAMDVFKKGARMAKGTTSEKGLVYTYYANIFGPSQYRDVHDKIAQKFFKKMFSSKIKVGVIRTRLGLKGYETKGPEEAAKELFKMIG